MARRPMVARKTVKKAKSYGNKKSPIPSNVGTRYKIAKAKKVKVRV